MDCNFRETFQSGDTRAQFITTNAALRDLAATVYPTVAIATALVGLGLMGKLMDAGQSGTGAFVGSILAVAAVGTYALGAVFQAVATQTVKPPDEEHGSNGECPEIDRSFHAQYRRFSYFLDRPFERTNHSLGL